MDIVVANGCGISARRTSGANRYAGAGLKDHIFTCACCKFLNVQLKFNFLCTYGDIHFSRLAAWPVSWWT